MKTTTSILKLTAAAAMLASSALAQADVLNFETVDEDGPAPFFYQVDTSSQQAYKPYNFGSFWLASYAIGAVAGDRSGVLVDGANAADICSSGVTCPTGNSSAYYGGINDGYIAFGLQSGAAFRLTSFDASVFKIDGQVYPASPNPSSILILRGWRADNTFLDSAQIAIGGPVDGSFAFKTYDLKTLSATFANTEFVAARVISYSWNGTTYTNGSNLNNIALDNLTVSAVPEPGSWALMGLGLLGVAAYSRRRRAAAHTA